MEQHYDALVVGAGIAGLASARLLARAGLRVGVLEAAVRAGGAIHSAHFALDGRDYWLELGAHTLFNSYRTLLTLFPELHLEQILLRRRRLPFRLCDAGELRSIFGALRWGELVRSLPNAIRRDRAGERVADYFGAVAGVRNYNGVIGPSLDALLCQPAADFPADLLFKKREHARTFPPSFSLRGGLGALPDRLTQGFELHTCSAVRHLARSDEGMVCKTAADTFIAPLLLLATPADEAARLLEVIAPELATRLARIPMSELDSTAVVIRAEAVSLAPMAGVVARDAPWYSMVSRDVVPDNALRGFTFHFRPRLPPAERIAIVAKALRVESAHFLATAHTRHRLPALRLGHQARVEEIDTALSRLPIGIAGNYFGGLSIEDCVARAQSETARLLRWRESGWGFVSGM